MDDQSAGKALVSVLPDSRWLGVSLARAYLAVLAGQPGEATARLLYDAGAFTLTRSREAISEIRDTGFLSLIPVRKKMGSAENPVTKLFPGAVTEQNFLHALDDLRALEPEVAYTDERFASHSLVDFTLHAGQLAVPINVKNAGTRFENAMQLVGIEPNDCIPIPAYKAFDAIEKEPNLLYVVAIDYSLLSRIETYLLTLLTDEEKLVWSLLNERSGKYIRDAEDRFIYSTVVKHWEQFSQHHVPPNFRAISARRAIRILQTLPKRTPGLGLRAWGTGASAEVNVHIRVSEETKPWNEVHTRIAEQGLRNIVDAINRKRTEVVFDPEI